MDTLRVVVPGEPCAQGRGRVAVRGGHGRIYDPPKARAWKGVAQVHYLAALDVAVRRAPLFPAGVALEVSIVAVFGLAKSHHRKSPVPRRPKVSTPDADNVGKAVLDSGNSILWFDDAQVVRLVVEKLIGAQGEPPRVELTVRALEAR